MTSLSEGFNRVDTEEQLGSSGTVFVDFPHEQT